MSGRRDFAMARSVVVCVYGGGISGASLVSTSIEPQATPSAGMEFEELRAEKADRLKELMKRKPGEKGYKRSLKAYLEADAEFEKVLMKRLRHAESASEAP